MEYIIERFQDTKLVKRDYNKPDHCEIRFLDEPRKRQDAEIAVYYFPGNGGISAKDANGGCKMIEKGLMLAFKDKEDLLGKVSLYGVYYGLNNKTDDVGKMSKEEREMFVTNHLMSRCLDRNRKLLPIEEICKNLSKVTFVGYCYGAEEINNVVDDFRKELREYFSDEEVKNITNHMFAVSYAPNKIDRMCPDVRFYSLSDRNVVGGLVGSLFEDNYESLFDKKLDGIIVDYKKSGQSFWRENQERFVGEEVVVFSTKMINESDSGKDEHFVQNLTRNYNWELENFKDKNLDCVSQMFFYSISEGVDRSLATEMTGATCCVDMQDLYKTLQREELSFKPGELRDHTMDGEGK